MYIHTRKKYIESISIPLLGGRGGTRFSNKQTNKQTNILYISYGNKINTSWSQRAEPAPVSVYQCPL